VYRFPRGKGLKMGRNYFEASGTSPGSEKKNNRVFAISFCINPIKTTKIQEIDNTLKTIHSKEPSHQKWNPKKWL
jgi:hypothetical protein